MKKTVTYLLCAALLMFALSACGSDKGKVTPKPSSDIVVTATPIPTVRPSENVTPNVTGTPHVSVPPETTHPSATVEP